MSRIGEFTVPANAFFLADTLNTVPEMVVEIQKIVAHSRDELAPYFWVHHGDKEKFDDAIRHDATLENVVLLDEFERGTSYRGTWTRNAEAVAYGYIEAGATILEATGQNETWTLRMQFDDQDALTDFQEYCHKKQIPFTLEQLYNPTQPMGGGQFGLTEMQHERLVYAYQRGYFDVPRQVSMVDLAQEFDTTQQTLSKQFRRAFANLIGNTLVVRPGGGERTN
jgi:predicted DNA binding protein